ncbi:hypothetical protein [Microbispora sp. H11081]|uniref:hypothetical protein n=1 Tax=Microbispora sp. H11081 TaxID=2729107 RepID=UPI0014733E71|nr:hypothetical protein [Microbispora sp. H11081]
MIADVIGSSPRLHRRAPRADALHRTQPSRKDTSRAFSSDEGLVELRRGRAATITDLAAERGLLRLREAAEEFAGAVRRLGTSEEEALEAVRKALAER